MDKSISDSSISRICCCIVPSVSSTSLYSNSLSHEFARSSGLDIDSARLGEALSGSLPEPPGDLPLLMSFLVLDLDLEEDLPLPQKEDSSSMAEIVVAAVAVEFDRDENFMRLPSAVVVVWVIVEDRLADVLDRL